MPRAGAETALLAVLLAAGGGARAANADELRPYQASYRGIWHGLVVAVSEVKLEQTGDTWTFRSGSTPRGIGRLAAGSFPPRQVSIVRVTDAGVQPQGYSSLGGERARSTDLSYDWQSSRVTGTLDGAEVNQPLAPGVQDDGSVQLALMAELLAGRTPGSFLMIDRGGTRAYQFARESEATLRTRIGAIATVVYRAQKAGSPRITRFWCAPDRGYIPLKVEQTRGDDVQWTMEIERLTRD